MSFNIFTRSTIIISSSIRPALRSIGLKYHLRSSPIQLRLMNTVREEDITRYCAGGYHPVRIGDYLKRDRLEIVAKLGYGVYSTVWLAWERRPPRGRFVAIKILTADTFGHGHDTFELDILKTLKRNSRKAPGGVHILHIFDNFEHEGPNGKHVCLVSKAMGPALSEYRRYFPNLMIPLPILKTISRQLLQALAFLHDTCQVIHTDIKPDNILIETSGIYEIFEKAWPKDIDILEPEKQASKESWYRPSISVFPDDYDLTCPEDLSIKLADFGTASWIDNHLTEWIQPPKLRAPEVILGAGWDYKVDIWSAGLIIWELAQGQLAFDGQWTRSGDYNPEAHLSQITSVAGDIPKHILDRSTYRSLYYDDQGQLLTPRKFGHLGLEFITTNLPLGVERDEFLSFVTPMFNPDPAERPDASELLKSPWLTEEEK